MSLSRVHLQTTILLNECCDLFTSLILPTKLGIKYSNIFIHKKEANDVCDRYFFRNDG